MFIGSSASMSPTITAIAAAKIENGAGKAVKLAGNGKVTLCTTAGEEAIGFLILQTADVVNEGDSVTIQIMGQATVLCNTTVTNGTAVMVNTNGAVIPATDGKFIIGYALEYKADGAGLLHILIDRGYKPAAAGVGG